MSNGLSKKRVLDRLMASTAVPGVFDSVVVDGGVYVDGGLEACGGENVPVSPVTEKLFRLGCLDARRLPPAL